MPRSYRHIKEYEKEILELKGQGITEKEIGKRLGFSKKQINNFITRYRANIQKLGAGIPIKPKGRPRSNGDTLPPSIQQLSKLTLRNECCGAFYIVNIYDKAAHIYDTDGFYFI